LSYSIKHLHDRIKTGELSPVDLIKISLERIRKFNPSLNSFITVIEEDAYKKAEIAENQIRHGIYLGPLHGIPFSIKDVFFAKGVKCTAGSKIMYDRVSKIDATVVSRLKNAGAILIGTNNLNEFASGITGINPFYGSSKNPWNTSKISGGSSGGSVVAVSTGMVPVSLGTDTGGSILVPSSFCGVFGFKPTYGRASRYGVIPFAPSMDHVGCITKSAWDAAAVLECISGWDPLDQTSKNKTVPAYTKIIEDSRVDKISLGIPKNYFLDCLNQEVQTIFYNFIDDLKSLEVPIYEINLLDTDKYYYPCIDIARAEAAETHLEWIETRLDDYSEDCRKGFIHGMKLSAVKYIRDIKIIRKIRNQFLDVLKNKVDLIVMPTTILTAPGFNEPKVNVCGKMLDLCESLNRNNIVFDSIGLPALNVPAGLTKDHMPVGVQIVGPPFGEAKILKIAYNYECAYGSINKFIPPLGL